MSGIGAWFNDDCGIALSRRTEAQNESCMSTEMMPYNVLLAVAVVAIFASNASGESVDDEGRKRSGTSQLVRAAGGAAIVGGIGYAIMSVTRVVKRRNYVLARAQHERDRADPVAANLEIGRAQADSARRSANAQTLQSGLGVMNLFARR